jgi:hypothetical protein
LSIFVFAGRAERVSRSNPRQHLGEERRVPASVSPTHGGFVKLQSR